MTTLHHAPGETRPEGVIDGGQQTEPLVDAPQRAGDIVISRRRLLWWVGGGAGAVVLGTGGAAWYTTRPRRPNTSGAAPLHSGQPVDGGRGGNNPAGDEAGTPQIPINARNPNHIKDVMLGDPTLQGRVRAFLGTENIRLIPPGTDQHYPWLQVSTPQSEHLTLTLRPTGVETAPGERAPTWAETQASTQFDANAWTLFEGGAMLRFNDQYPRGRTIAEVTGYANIGTPDERRFTIETQYLERVASMAPDVRRAEFTGLTSALLGARALG